MSTVEKYEVLPYIYAFRQVIFLGMGRNYM